MPSDSTPAATRAATGGPSIARLHRKRWWQQLADRFDAALQRTVEEDSFERKPAATVLGVDEETWRQWLEFRGATIDSPRLSLGIMVDALSPLGAADARALVRGLHRRVVPAGRLLLVERVVHQRPGEAVRGVHDLLGLVTDGTGGAVSLADVESMIRPGEQHPSTVVLELFRLALPEDAG